MKISKTQELIGIGFKPFDLKIDRFYGCFVSFLTFSITHKKIGNFCNSGEDYCIFYVGIHRRENNSLLFIAHLFYCILIRFYIIPQKFIGCKKCKNKVEFEDNGGRTGDYYCDKCNKYMGIKDTEIIISKKL